MDNVDQVSTWPEAEVRREMGEARVARAGVAGGGDCDERKHLASPAHAPQKKNLVGCCARPSEWTGQMFWPVSRRPVEARGGVPFPPHPTTHEQPGGISRGDAGTVAFDAATPGLRLQLPADPIGRRVLLVPSPPPPPSGLRPLCVSDDSYPDGAAWGSFRMAKGWLAAFGATTPARGDDVLAGVIVAPSGG